MEVKTRARIPEVVEDIEDERVPDRSSDQGNWPLPIYSDRGSVECAIRISGNPADGKVSLDSLREDLGEQGEENRSDTRNASHYGEAGVGGHFLLLCDERKRCR